MKSIQLARLKNYVLVKKAGKKFTMTKFVKGTVYVLPDSEADNLLSKSDSRDIPIFKLAKSQSTEAVRPVEKSLRVRLPKSKKAVVDSDGEENQVIV